MIAGIITAIVLSVNSNKENRDMGSDSCKTDLECNPINLTLNTTKKKISLPTHCLNIFNKDEPMCAWLWPEGLYELYDFDWDKYIDPTDPSVDTTTNLRDWMKSRKYDLYTNIDLNKLPQHHQTIEIVDEDMCPFPFMDFISLGSRDIEKGYKQFGVCAVSPSNSSRIIAQLGTLPMMSVQGAVTRFRSKK